MVVVVVVEVVFVVLKVVLVVVAVCHKRHVTSRLQARTHHTSCDTIGDNNEVTFMKSRHLTQREKFVFSQINDHSLYEHSKSEESARGSNSFMTIETNYTASHSDVQ